MKENYYNMTEYSPWSNDPVDNKKLFKVVDGDSIYDDKNRGYRIAGYDTYEIDHGRPEDLFSRTHAGEVQTEILNHLVKNGWNSIEYTGEQDNRRDEGEARQIINLRNSKTGQSTADVMYYQGLVGLRGGSGPFAGQNISEEHLKLYRQGQLAREQGQTSKTYDSFRDKLAKATEKDRHFVKEIAPTEYMFDPMQHRDVAIRHSDRNIYNEARSPLKSSFSGGVDSLNAGFWSVVEMVGNRTGFNHLEKSAKLYKDINLQDVAALPKWTSDIHDVNSISDFADWGAGALGGSAPFFALMAAGFIPGMAPVSFGSMAWVHTGMTINDMKGDIDKISFKKALGAGLAMAWFERLGGKLIFGKFDPVKFQTEKGRNELIKQYAKHKNISTADARFKFGEAGKSEMVDMLSDIKRNDVIWKLYAKGVGARAASGLIGEAGTEAAQEATQYGAAYWGSEKGKGVFDKQEFRKIIENAAAAGGFLGMSIGGGLGAYSEDSPISLRVRQTQWKKGQNTKINIDEPLNIQSILNQSAKQNIERNRLPDGTLQTNVKENQKKVSEDLDKFEKQQKEKGTWARIGEVIWDNEALSTGYNVLLKRLGNLIDGSETLKAEMSYSGWIKDRFASGASHVQTKRYFQGQQHALAHDIINELRVGLKISGDTHANRIAAYKTLSEFAQFKNPQLLDNKVGSYKFKKWAEENNITQEKIASLEASYTRMVKEYEANQRSIYQLVNRKYSPEEGYTFTQEKLSADLVRKNREKYINVLKDKYNFSDLEANQEADYIENVPGGYDIQEYANTEFLTKKPVNLKMNQRYDAASPNFKEFWEPTSYDSLLLRGTEISHYVGDTLATGFGGDRLNSKILQIRKELESKYGKETADRWMPEITNTIYNHYRAHRGEYKKVNNENLRAMYSNAGALMSLSYMPLAVVSSIPELSLAFLGADKEMFMKAVKKSGRMAGQGLADQMKKIGDSSINKNERQYALDVMRARGMLNHELGASNTAAGVGGGGGAHILDAEYGNDRMNWLQRRVMPGFYKITLLTPFTTAMRMIRGSIANDWVADQMSKLEKALYTPSSDIDPIELKQALEKFEVTEFNELPIYIQESLGADVAQFAIKTDKELFKDFNNEQALAFRKLKEMGADPRGMIRRFRSLEKNFQVEKKAFEIELKNKTNPDSINYDPNYLNTEEGKVAKLESEKRFEDWLSTNRHNYNSYTGRQAIELAREIDLIRQNFVDSALVNPDPGRRPLFYSDGRVRLLVLFQGYLSTFSAQVIVPILRNLANKGSPQDQINAASIMMGTLFLGFIGQAIKDEIKYGDSPSWLSDAEYFQRGIQASGLMGQTERVFNLFFPLYSSEDDSIADRAWAEVGPAAGTVDSIGQSLKWAMEGEGERAINKALKVTPAIGVFTSARQKTAKELAGLFGE